MLIIKRASVKLSGYSGIEMLYNILKYGFIKEADR